MTLLDVAPIIPVVTLTEVDHAVPVARALRDGGLPLVELTLRTPAGLDALERMAAEVPDVLVGAGTVLTAAQADAALSRGARFLVTPGTTPTLLRQLAGAGVPVLPGIATVGEALAAVELGFTDLKFFPAGPAGGSAYLKALAGPLPELRFCPTGGVSPDNLTDYLVLPSVPAVGGSWLTPADALDAGDWDRVRDLAADAVRRAAAGQGVPAPRPRTAP